MLSQNNDFYLTSLSITITCLLDNLSLLVSLYFTRPGLRSRYFWRITRSTAIHGLGGAEERLQLIFWNTSQQEADKYCRYASL